MSAVEVLGANWAPRREVGVLVARVIRRSVTICGAIMPLRRLATTLLAARNLLSLPVALRLRLLLALPSPSPARGAAKEAARHLSNPLNAHRSLQGEIILEPPDPGSPRHAATEARGRARLLHGVRFRLRPRRRGRRRHGLVG